MALDKVLTKIQGQIHELAPTLELFVEDSIQPSVNDCEKLQKQLVALQECLAVYKYNKQEKEISPSFNIHAKVSNTKPESEIKQENVEIVTEEIKNTIEESITEKIEINELRSESKVINPLTIAINDKFRFINELFRQNGGEYNVAIEQINSLNNWNDTEMYLTGLKSIYDWKDNSETVIYFNTLIKKRFI